MVLLSVAFVTMAQEAQPNEIVYIVQEGDSLSLIAARFGVTLEQVRYRNQLGDADVIRTGQRLIIPPPNATPIPTLSLTVIPTSTARLLPTAAPTPTPVSALPFELGGHVTSFSYPRQMTASGMTWARSILRWTRGSAPDIAQGAIDAARSSGFKVLLTVVGDPAEMSGDLTRYSQEFATFLGGVAGLQPDAIEVWTAPNVDSAWARGLISPQAYTQMLTLAFEAIKRVNPSTLVVSAAPEPTARRIGCTENGCEDEAFLRAMASAGAGTYADCIGMRYTMGAVSPDESDGDPRGDARAYYYSRMTGLYVEIFPNKPLCFVELGFLAGAGVELSEAFVWASETSIQDQAEWLARAAILARQTGRVRMLIVYNVDSTTLTPDSAYAGAYAIVRSAQGGEQCLACITLGAAMGVR
jgi:hypothetical protein